MSRHTFGGRVSTGEVTGTCARLACSFTDLTQRMLKYMVSTRDLLCWVVFARFFDTVGKRHNVEPRCELETRESLTFLIGWLPLLHSSQLASPWTHKLQIGNKIENNRPVSNYRRYSLTINRKHSWPHEITDVAVLLKKKEIGRIMAGCWRCTYPSIHFFHCANTL